MDTVYTGQSITFEEEEIQPQPQPVWDYETFTRHLSGGAKPVIYEQMPDEVDAGDLNIELDTLAADRLKRLSNPGTAFTEFHTHTPDFQEGFKLPLVMYLPGDRPVLPNEVAYYPPDPRLLYDYFLSPVAIKRLTPAVGFISERMKILVLRSFDTKYPDKLEASFGKSILQFLDFRRWFNPNNPADELMFSFLNICEKTKLVPYMALYGEDSVFRKGNSIKSK